MITVKVARIPGETVVVELDRNSASVAEVLQAANVSVESGEVLKLGGLDTTLNAVVTNGMRITLVRGAKGN